MRLRFAMLGLLVCGCHSTPQTLQCNTPENSRLVDRLGESADQMRMAGVALGAGNENAVGQVISEVRKRRPHASTDQIVNYLVVAYCPEVNRKSDLDRKGKQAAVEAFATRVGMIAAKLPK